jgi:Cu-processing system ATP-binding protein
MDLPLRLEVHTSEAGAAAVRDVLAPLPLGEPRWQGLQLLARCPRDAKMAVLAALAGLGSAVRDLAVHEPSLEDVYFGFAD